MDGKYNEVLMATEKEHIQEEQTLHMQCYDAMMGQNVGSSDKGAKAQMNKENYFNIREHSRYGWVTYGEICLWCQKQYKINTKESTDMADDILWNMILHTRNAEGEHSYQTKFWPKMHMVMIKVRWMHMNMEQEESMDQNRSGSLEETASASSAGRGRR